MYDDVKVIMDLDFCGEYIIYIAVLEYFSDFS